MTRLMPVAGRAERGALAPPVLFWCDTTARQPFETGIQRVTRRLARGLEACGLDVVPVGWDAGRRLMRPLGDAGAAGPDRFEAASGGDWLILPEIPSTLLGEDIDPIRLARASGLRVAAIVHDLIPIRLAHLYSPAQTLLYRRYFRMLARADLVLATTRLVAGHLRAYLEGEGLPVPEIGVVPLPAQFADRPRLREAPPPRAAGEPLRLLAVSTWEPRKNLPRLLRALDRAQRSHGAAIRLTLVGRRGASAALDAEIEGLLAGLPQAQATERIDDDALVALYRSHHASVYPSCDEGFGLPVLESLWLGRPCLCHAGSAMAEVAPGGGTLMLDMAGEAAIADGLGRLAREPGLLDRLSGEARGRPLRDWTDYAADVADRTGLGGRG